MSWATPIIARLQRGETVSFRPRGNSMRGLIESGELVYVMPIRPDSDAWLIDVGSIVLCKVKGKHYLHLVKAIQQHESGGEIRRRFQIGNNCGHINGWIGIKQIYGLRMDPEFLEDLDREDEEECYTELWDK